MPEQRRRHQRLLTAEHGEAIDDGCSASTATLASRTSVNGSCAILAEQPHPVRAAARHRPSLAATRAAGAACRRRHVEERVELLLVDEVLRADLLGAELAGPYPAANRLGVATAATRRFRNGDHSSRMLPPAASRYPGAVTTAGDACRRLVAPARLVAAGAHGAAGAQARLRGDARPLEAGVRGARGARPRDHRPRRAWPPFFLSFSTTSRGIPGRPGRQRCADPHPRVPRGRHLRVPAATGSAASR